MRKAVFPAILLLLATLTPASGQVGAAGASAYLYPLMIEDAEGDHFGLGGSSQAPVPGAANPENDLLAFEATDDGATVVFRVTMATMEFGAPGTGPATVSLSLTGPGGEDWEVTVAYDSDGAVTNVADFDPGTGDPDELMPGARAELDTAANAVYIFADHSATGLATGDEITLDGLNSGRGVSTPATSITFGNRDSVAVEGVTYTLARGAFEATPPQAPTLYEDLDTLPLEVSRSFDEATTETHVVNWTTELTAAQVSYVVAGTAGTVAVSLVDGDDLTILQNTFSGEEDNTLVQRNLTAGVWMLALEFQGFVGSVDFTVEEAPEEGGPAPTSTGGPTPTGGTGGTGSPTGGATTGPGATVTDDGSEDSPGLGFLLLLGAVAAAVVLVRRRL